MPIWLTTARSCVYDGFGYAILLGLVLVSPPNGEAHVEAIVARAAAGCGSDPSGSRYSYSYGFAKDLRVIARGRWSESNYMTTNQPSPVELIIKLTPAAAHPDSVEYRCVQAAAATFDTFIQPLHPSTSDPELATFYFARVAPSTLDELIRRLLACEGVEGAYGKAAGKPPKGE